MKYALAIFLTIHSLTGGELSGGTEQVKPAAAAQMQRSTLGTLGRLAALGGTTGAISGAGSATEGERGTGALVGGTLGTAIGVGAPVALRGFAVALGGGSAS